jgi:hypothetical protein
MIRDNKTSYLLTWDKVLFNYLIYLLYFNNNEHINKNKGEKKKVGANSPYSSTKTKVNKMLACVQYD